MRLPLIIGHRGFAARFPDNSLAGIRAAIAAGADGVEVDVRPSSDGVWVCHHDLRIDRRPLGEWRWGALRARGVAPLERVVDAVPAGRWLFVEVKPLGREVLARHIDVLQAQLAQAAARLRVISSSLVVLGEVEREIAGAKLSWVFGGMPEWLPSAVELSPRHTLVERLLASGRPLHPWTVNSRERMGRLAGLGVASITTNRPDVAVGVIRG